MISIQAIYDTINTFYFSLVLFALVFGVFKLYRMGSLIMQRGRILGVAGPSALAMSNEYSFKLIFKQFVVALFCLNFVSLFNAVASDISGETYSLAYASFEGNAEESLLIFGALYEAIKAYGFFVIFSVVMKFSRNHDPFVQRGETPLSKLAWQLLGGFGLVFILEIMEDAGRVIKLVPFTAVTELIRSVQ
ncbi:hypothetical protein [Reinekea sp. G2M2-21]|uniref:hypothetical protein n=1 Tax=Reinekea sp. G2M2-21 TaxID=2788942 RepID=UPI0018AA939C|nr:hypothetical protein [Reinekea sp. G2M2-21]